MPFHRDLPESRPTEKSMGALRGYVEAEKLLNIAAVMPAAVPSAGAPGWWVGNRLHQHWIFIVGIVFGCISGLFYVIQQAIAAEKISRKEDPVQNGSGEGKRRPRTMTQETHPIVDLTQADLDAMLHRALRNTLILGTVAALIVWIGGGWRSAACSGPAH